MRRWVRVAVVPLLLAGCSGGVSSPQPSVTATGPVAGKISVQAAGGEGEIGALRELVAAFERAHPGTTVEIVPIPSQGDHVAKLTAAFAAGNPPDVFLLNYRRLGQFARRGVVEPVAGADLDGLYDQVVDAFTYENRVLCIPQNASNPVVYYNEALLRQAEVEPRRDRAMTLDEFERFADRIKDAGVEAIAFDPSLIRAAPFIWSAGGDFVDDPARPTKVDIGNAGARRAIEWLLRLQEHGFDATERAAQEPEEAFLAGRVAMYVESRRPVPGMRATRGLRFDVMPLPRADRPASVLHSDGYCVAARSDNLPLARAFARYAVAAEGARILARTGRTVPSLESVASGADFLDPRARPRNSQVFLDAVPVARAMPSVAGWDEAEEATDELLAQLFAGRLSYDETARRIAEETERILARRR